MEEKLKQLIKQAISPNADRLQAEKDLIVYQNTQPAPYITTLCKLFREKETDISFTAGILMRNAVLNIFNEQMWASLGVSKIVKETCYETMKEERNGKVAASLLSGVLRHEFATGEFTNFYTMMREMICMGGFMAQNAVLCIVQATNSMRDVIDKHNISCLMMEALSIDKPFLPSVLCSLNEVQNSIRKDMGKSANQWIKVFISFCGMEKEIASLAIINITTFINEIINYVTNELENLNKFMMGLFQANEDVSIQAIEYFSVLAELEHENKEPYLSKIMDNLMPALLTKLKKNNGYDESIWSSHKAASSCLQVISVNYNFLSEQGLRNYIGETLINNNSIDNEMAMIALSAFLNHYIQSVGDKNKPMSGDVFISLRNMAKHLINSLGNTKFVESSLFAIAKICEANIFCIETDDLNALIDKITQILQSNIEESINAIGVISSIASFSLETHEIDRIDYLLCPVYPKLLQPLIDILDHQEFENFDPQLQTTVFSTIQSIIKICPDSFKTFLEQSLWVFILHKLELSYSDALKKNSNEIFLIEDLLCGFLCVAFEIHLKVQSKEGEVTLRKVFESFLSARFSAFTLEEVYRCLSTICSNKSLFITHINDFIPYIIRDLNLSDRGVIVSLITLIGDISTSLQLGFLPYADQMVPIFIELIKRPDISFDVKPQIILLFSDIVLSLGHNSKQYFFFFFAVIEQATSVERDFDPIFVDNLRYASLVLIESFFYSFGESDILNYKKIEIINILEKIAKEDKLKVCIKESLRLCGEVWLKFNLEESHWTLNFVRQYLNDSENKDIAIEVCEMMNKNECRPYY